MARQPCAVCKVADRAAGLTKCAECYMAIQPIAVRQERKEWREAAIPEPLRLGRVPKDDWPKGRRWCSGCQSFVRLADVGRGASRCKTCNSVSAHSAMVEKVYGINQAEYAALLKDQKGRCAICRNMPRTERLAVDHNHKTGKVRGLLCSHCNHDLLGAAHDSVEILRAAVAYLVKPPADRVLT